MKRGACARIRILYRSISETFLACRMRSASPSVVTSSGRVLRAHSAGAGPAARIGAVDFIHRFGSALNPHLHFHCVVVDGVLASAPAGDVVFRAATGIEAEAIAAVQATIRRRLLQSFVRRGLLAGDDAPAMQAWAHGGGFSVNAAVRIEAADRPGLERLLRNSRPPAVRAGTVAATGCRAPARRSRQTGSWRQWRAAPDPAATARPPRRSRSAAAGPSASLLRRAGTPLTAAPGGDHPSPHIS